MVYGKLQQNKRCNLYQRGDKMKCKKCNSEVIRVKNTTHGTEYLANYFCSKCNEYKFIHNLKEVQE